MLSVEEALAKMRGACGPVAGSEKKLLHQALYRVLADECVSPVNVPPWDNSAMDGYAFCSKDLAADNSLPLSDTFAAGCAPGKLKAGTAARIFTGAPVPVGADTVEMQENTAVENGRVIFTAPPAAGKNIRRCGEDIKQGDKILAAGKLLQPADVGLLASVGIDAMPVYRQLKVGIVSTGDELAEPGEPLQPGQIYNSNRFTLQALLQDLQCEVVDGGRVEDDLQATENLLTELAGQVDVIISSGGVSVGDEDHVKKAVENIGQLDLWKIAIKPGKPLAFGSIRDAVFFGLPGNPVSTFVTFLVLVKPLLLQMRGLSDSVPRQFSVTADFDWPVKINAKPGNRQEYLRVRLQDDGQRASLFPNQGSGVLSSASWCDGLAVIQPGQKVSKGDRLSFLPVNYL